MSEKLKSIEGIVEGFCSINNISEKEEERLKDLIRNQYEDEDRITEDFWSCKSCDFSIKAYPGAIGMAHAHAETHAQKYGIVPAWLWPVANPSELNEYIEKERHTIIKNSS